MWEESNKKCEGVATGIGRELNKRHEENGFFLNVCFWVRKLVRWWSHSWVEKQRSAIKGEDRELCLKESLLSLETFSLKFTIRTSSNGVTAQIYKSIKNKRGFSRETVHIVRYFRGTLYLYLSYFKKAQDLHLKFLSTSYSFFFYHPWHFLLLFKHVEKHTSSAESCWHINGKCQKIKSHFNALQISWIVFRNQSLLLKQKKKLPNFGLRKIS